MEAYKREFIEFLQSAGVLKFGDFTAKSGRKIPYFVNAGMIKTGDQISKLGEFYAKAYFDKLGKKEAVLYGPAYKGIPLSISAAVALSKNGLDVPFFFNRKEVKDHGEGGTFVGYIPQAGQEIVIIEDVITAGTAIRALAPIVTVMYLDSAVDGILKGLGEQVAVVRYNVYDTAMCVGLVYTLVPLLGTAGYLTTIVISEVFNMALSASRLVSVTCFKVDMLRWALVPTSAAILSTVFSNLKRHLVAE